MRASWVAAVWLALSCCTPATAATLDADLAAQVDATVTEWLSSTDAPSVSIAIVRGGALVYAKAYGTARRNPSAAATSASGYAVDSVSKEFTAAAVLLLAEQHKLSLDDTLDRWLADVGPAGRVTLRQLLTQTSGIRDYWPQDFVTPEMTHPTTADAIIQEWAKRPLDFEPGSEWQYSNTNYVLAARVVERVSGEAFFDFLQRHVFGPLRMAHVVDLAPPTRGAFGAADVGEVVGYTRYGLSASQRAPTEGAGWLFGAASLQMRPTDLALWDVSVIDRSLLRAPSYDALLSPVTLANGVSQPYGLGLDIEQVRGRTRVGHAGGGSGFLADNRIWPAERSAVIVFTNNDWASPTVLSDRIAFLILKPSVAEARARTLFASLQNGLFERRLFTPVGNFYFSDAVLAELRDSLRPLGPARDMELERESSRGGMLTRRWKILCAHARLEITERGYRDGQLDEFLVTPLED